MGCTGGGDRIGGGDCPERTPDNGCPDCTSPGALDTDGGRGGRRDGITGTVAGDDGSGGVAENTGGGVAETTGVAAGGGVAACGTGRSSSGTAPMGVGPLRSTDGSSSGVEYNAERGRTPAATRALSWLAAERAPLDARRTRFITPAAAELAPFIMLLAPPLAPSSIGSGELGVDVGVDTTSGDLSRR